MHIVHFTMHCTPHAASNRKTGVTVSNRLLAVACKLVQKIIKFLSVRCVFQVQIAAKSAFGRDSAPDPTGGAYDATSNPGSALTPSYFLAIQTLLRLFANFAPFTQNGKYMSPAMSTKTEGLLKDTYRP